MGKNSRAVAVINIFVGMLIGLLLMIIGAAVKQESYGVGFVVFVVCLGLVAYRIHRVFVVAD